MDVEAPGRPPASLGLSLAALTTRYEKDRLGFLLDTVREHGPVVELAPGVHLVCDPPAVMDVFRGTGDSFKLPLNLTRDSVEGRQGAPAYDAWMAARREISAVLKETDRFEEHRTWLQAEVVTLADTWAAAGSVANPLPELEVLAGRSVARFALGDDGPGESFIDETAARSRRFVETQAVNSETPIELPRWARKVAPRYRNMHAAYRRLGAIIAERLPTAGPDTLTGRLRAAGIADDKTVEVTCAVMAAGTSIPATSFQWALVAMAEHPDLAAGLVDHERVPDFLQETLRVWPPAWLLRRQAARDVNVGGWQIPAEATVMLSPFAVHRTAADYPDPDEFRPSRWEGLHPVPGAFIPYGAGRHWCVGAPLAELERTTVLGTLAERLTFTRAVGLELLPAHALLPMDPALTVTAR